MARKDLIQLFRQEIDEGTIVNDSLIPTFRQLGERYSCSAATVKRMVDQLENRGILHTIRGRGTFVAGSAIPPQRNYKQLIGCIILDDRFKIELERAKDAYLMQKYFFSIYNASADAQSPEREKLFLEVAKEQEFCAIVMEATPVEPVNTALFQRMRFDGMKIVHLSPYLDDMREECFFTPDFYAAGQLGVVKCELKQYNNLVMLRGKEKAPFSNAWEKGVRQMAANMNIRLLPALYGRTDDEFRAGIRTLPPSTAVFSVNTEQGEKVIKIAREEGLSVPGSLGVMSLSQSVHTDTRHSYFSFDYRKILHDALAYCNNRSINAMKMVQNYYPPSFVDLQTL